MVRGATGGASLGRGPVEEAIGLGVEHVWMQPGAESEAAVLRAQEAGLGVIADGSCILVVLGYRE